MAIKNLKITSNKNPRFKDKNIESFFNGKKVSYFEKIERVGRKKLYMLVAATNWKDVKKIGKNLHKLKHGRKGQFSLDVNDQYRLCFIWEDNQAWEIEIVDYHDEKK